ncbi:MAG: succinylglutamate desuccinylase/aspartoacylase family protein [Candidatus Staskawiczbacteria bacterium]|nr:succinylglutamate desuccinylase/aspartoacylase family protein [Candidatus Staskawiczbacteria bacterium]
MKIILNIATHGNEKIGFEVAKEIEKLNINKNILVVQIANKKAFDLNKRYIDQDLNRSFPGKKHGNYEEKIAYKISPIIKSADIVIDIHSTTSNLKDTLIITNLNKKTREYVEIIQPKYVLIMNPTKNNALISQAKVGIAFEYGKDKDLSTLRNTVLGIKKLLKYLCIINFIVPVNNATISYFNVVSVVPKLEGYKLINNIKNYKLVKKNYIYARKGKNLLIADEDFYPILFGQKNYNDIFGFKGKKIVLK